MDHHHLAKELDKQGHGSLLLLVCQGHQLVLRSLRQCFRLGHLLSRRKCALALVVHLLVQYPLWGNRLHHFLRHLRTWLLFLLLLVHHHFLHLSLAWFNLLVLLLVCRRGHHNRSRWLRLLLALCSHHLGCMGCHQDLAHFQINPWLWVKQGNRELIQTRFPALLQVLL